MVRTEEGMRPPTLETDRRMGIQVEATRLPVLPAAFLIDAHTADSSPLLGWCPTPGRSSAFRLVFSSGK